MTVTEDLKQKIKMFTAKMKKGVVALKSGTDWSFAPQLSAAVKIANTNPTVNEGEVNEAAKKKAFDEAAKSTIQLLDNYDRSLTNVNNLMDSYTNYTKENKDLEKQLKEMGADIDTNDRKTYYEDEATDSLNYYYSWMINIYFILVVIYAVSWFLFPSLYTNIFKGCVLIFFATFPFFSTRMLQWVFYLYNQFLELLPNKANSSI
jgi:hypothetical protein